MTHWMPALSWAIIAAGIGQSAELIGHWPLTHDAGDASAHEQRSVAHGVTFAASGATFDGLSSQIEIARPQLNLGTGDFTISVWIQTAEQLDDTLGDILSCYDPSTRTGFNFGIQNFAGVTSSQANFRHLYFGIDAGHIDDQWLDCGRPGENMFAYSLCVFQGKLYVGTFEHGADQAGHVYRYAGNAQWIDCGSPDRSNTVQSLAVHQGQLYAGVSRYEARGSALPDSPNKHDGGKIYRYQGDGHWVDCGKLENSQSGASFTVGGLGVYQGKLYAGVSKPPGRGLYRYDGERRWAFCGDPGRRVTNPLVFNGSMYLTSLDKAHVFRYDQHGLTDCGIPRGASQTYGLAVHRGQLYTSTWPEGKVFRYAGDSHWIDTGRLGSEREVMGMVVYNGKLYAGTLPLAEVYRYDGDGRWTRTGQLDKTPDVKYRRAWSMAVHQGKLYCGTLPSGHVYSLEAGKCVTHDWALPSGWVHLAAVRAEHKLLLFVNGRRVAESSQLIPAQFDLSHRAPLWIGSGPQDFFNGRMRDLRIYRNALPESSIAELAMQGEAP